MSALQKEIEAAVAKAVAPLVAEVAELRKEMSGPKPLLTVEEKAAQLRIHPNTLRRKAREGLVKFDRVGNRMMFTP